MTQFRLITYNIHKGIGGIDRRYRLSRIIDTLRSYQPDILLLQEVDEGARRSRGDVQIELLGEALGLSHREYQPNVHLRQGRYGNAVISRFPLSRRLDVELTVGPKKRRRALIVDARIGSGQSRKHVTVANLHLGLAGFERAIQSRRLLAIGRVGSGVPKKALIVAGDFNDGRGVLGKRIWLPAGFQLASGRTKTFPAVRPLRSLDRIYYRGTLRLETCHASRTRLARMASDHLPLVADFIVTSAS